MISYEEYERINTDTEFNRKTLLDGTYSDQYLQVGANAKQGIKVTIKTTAWDKNLYLSKSSGDKDDDAEGGDTIATKTLNGVEYSENADGKFVAEDGTELDTLLADFVAKKTDLDNNDDNPSANALKAVAQALGYTVAAADATNAASKTTLKTELAGMDPTADITEGTKPAGGDGTTAAADEKIYNPLIFTERTAEGGEAAAKTKTFNDKVFTENEDGDFENEDGDKFDDLVAAMGKLDNTDLTAQDSVDAIAAAKKLGVTLQDETDATKTEADLTQAIADAGKVEAEGGDAKVEKSYDVNGEAISELLNNIDTMIKSVTTERSKLGAIQNRLEYTVKVDDNTAENLQSAESRIRDTDMADEMTRFSKESILQQAATSMLAQANQANQGVLSLLQ